MSDLSSFNKVLNQRNKLLKDISFRPDLVDTLPVWDMQLLEYGTRIIRKRKEFVEELNEIISEHRDDMLFSVDNVDIRKFGSQGQQRTSALSLKLSEIDLVRRSIHDTPVLLLDDVLSELDSNRQNYLLNSIAKIQTVITCTGLEEFVKNRFCINKIFQVINGNVYEKESVEEI